MPSIPRRGEVKKIIIFPAQIYVSNQKPPGPTLNRFRGVITEIISSEFMTRFRIRVSENILLAELDQDMFSEMGLGVGSEIFLILKLKWV